MWWAAPCQERTATSTFDFEPYSTHDPHRRAFGRQHSHTGRRSQRRRCNRLVHARPSEGHTMVASRSTTFHFLSKYERNAILRGSGRLVMNPPVPPTNHHAPPRPTGAICDPRFDAFMSGLGALTWRHAHIQVAVGSPRIFAGRLATPNVKLLYGKSAGGRLRRWWSAGS